jgi:hypothetical protein
MYGIIFKEVDYIGYKIIVFEVEKKALFYSLQNIGNKPWIPLALNFALHKVEVFDIMLRNWVENPQK